MLKRQRAIIIAMFLLTSPCAAKSRASDYLQGELVSKSQALLDAVAIGDKATWNKILAADGLFIDEEGQVRSKAQVIAEIVPLPAGVTGRMTIVNPKIAKSGDVAVLTYDAMETEVVSGQTLNSHYHQTDIYRQISHQWFLFGSHASILPAEAAPVGPPAPLADFAGIYSLGASHLEVTVENDTLVTLRDDRKDQLIPIGGDHFIRKGRPRDERIFVRNTIGAVIGFVDRRDNEDLRWTKV